MAKKFKDLTQEQVDRFHADLAKVGIDKDSVPKQVNTHDYPEGLKVGHSFNCSKLCHAKDIDELNTMIGLPSKDYQSGKLDDSGTVYPEAFAKTQVVAKAKSADDVKKALDPADHKTIRQAMAAYVQGDSAKVSSYKDVINTVHFSKPVALAAHAAQDITITADNPLIVKGDNGQPVSLTYGTVTIEKGGYIQADVPLTLNAQVFTIEQ
jgi:hypothetical protein